MLKSQSYEKQLFDSQKFDIFEKMPMRRNCRSLEATRRHCLTVDSFEKVPMRRNCRSPKATRSNCSIVGSSKVLKKRR
jgi:hypothetical protein